MISGLHTHTHVWTLCVFSCAVWTNQWLWDGLWSQQWSKSTSQTEKACVSILSVSQRILRPVMRELLPMIVYNVKSLFRFNPLTVCVVFIPMCTGLAVLSSRWRRFPRHVQSERSLEQGERHTHHNTRRCVSLSGAAQAYQGPKQNYIWGCPNTVNYYQCLITEHISLALRVLQPINPLLKPHKLLG